MKVLNTVTLDTNAFPADKLVARAQRLGMVVAVVTVTHRELEGTRFENASRNLESISESAVWGETRWDEGVWGDRQDGETLERVLEVVSNRSFPKPANRSRLSDGQRRQLRDAMILCAHLRAGRDVFVSQDERAFVRDGRREMLQAEFGTRVMTVREFVSYLSEREQGSEWE